MIAKSITPFSFGKLKLFGHLTILFRGTKVARPAFEDLRSSIQVDATCSSSTTMCDILPPTATSNAVEYSLSTFPNCTNGACIEELCVAVFGSDTVEISTTVDRTDAVYSADTTPERVEMQQQILGFDYVCPVEGTLSSSFGYRDHPMAGQERFHYGLDLSAEEGAVIRAFADGTVLAVAESTELGKYVEVVHANGYTTLYAHCSRINASAGQSVKAGDPIAEVGST